MEALAKIHAGEKFDTVSALMLCTCFVEPMAKAGLCNTQRLVL